MQLDCKKLYYCELGVILLSDIIPIANDGDYTIFIFDAYWIDAQISFYVDHVDDGIDDLFESKREDDDHDSCILNGQNDDNISNIRVVVVDFNDEMAWTWTCNDEFLSKLCAQEDKKLK